jgi:hypothetical protein
MRFLPAARDGHYIIFYPPLPANPFMDRYEYNLMVVCFMSEIEEMAKKMPPDLRIQVQNFMLFLLQQKKQNKRRILCQDWAGGLRDFRENYTSQELQKKALEWR